MANDVDITPLIDTGYVQKVVQEGQNAVFKNGRLVYIILDVDKPGKYFYDLRQVFNASTGEGGKDIKIMFMNNVEPWELNGKHVGVVGKYPSGESFNVLGTTSQANSSLVDFVFPQGFFQEAGIYKFQFVISDDSQNIATSHYCFFQVTQSAMSMALDWNNGVNPFDNEYMEWKQKVEQQVSGLSTSVKKLQGLVDTYTDSVNTAVDNAWNSKLNSENTWTGKQHFNEAEIGNLTVDEGLDAKKDLTVEQGLHVKGSADLPSNTVINNDFSVMDTLRVNNRGISGDVVAYLNDTTNYSSKKSSWLWADRIENNMNGNSFPMFRLHMAFTISGKDVGKPVAQFNSGFFEGQTNGPFTVPCKGGTVRFHIDADASTLILDSVDDVSGITSGSGSATIGTCQWL